MTAAALEVVVRDVAVATTEEPFLCVSMDLWPATKCNYGTCPWGNATSFLTADLRSLAPALKALAPVTLRLGGSLADKLRYGDACPTAAARTPFARLGTSYVGHGEGCLSARRWAELRALCEEAGCDVLWTVNALVGRRRPKGCGDRQCAGLSLLQGLPRRVRHAHRRKQRCCFNYSDGAWDSSEARRLLSDGRDAGWRPRAVAYGNEVGGTKGLEAQLSVASYVEGLGRLRALLDELWPPASERGVGGEGGGSPPVPLIGPDGTYEQEWFAELSAAAPWLHATSIHLYALGDGGNQRAAERSMDPSWLDQTRKPHKRPPRSAGRVWMSEAGGLSNSGQAGTTDSFLSSFWYLDHLASLARLGYGVFCRQTLLGGHYGLLDAAAAAPSFDSATATASASPAAAAAAALRPHPDFWAAVLWRELMGATALDASVRDATAAVVAGPGSNATRNASRMLRAYAHCARRGGGGGGGGVVLLLLNLSPHAEYALEVATLLASARRAGNVTRKEFHLSTGAGGLRSPTLLVNGEPPPRLTGAPGASSSAALVEKMRSVEVSGGSPLRVAPASIAFVQILGAGMSACE